MLFRSLAGLLSFAFLTGARPVQAAPSELFFSEYIEGSSNNKALEIFNGTGAAANLTNPSPSKNKVSYKYGAGAEYDFTQNIGARVEWERYQVSDGISGTVNVNFVSGSSRRITGPTRR